MYKRQVAIRIGPYQQGLLDVVGTTIDDEVIIGRDVLNHLTVTLNGDVYKRQALAQRAEAIYDGLNDACRAATHALFSRLVTLGEGVEDTRRRVLRSELDALDVVGRPPTADRRPPTVDEASGGGRRSAVSGLLDSFGRARLLAFDRDPLTRGPTVEIAHEALLLSLIHI